LNEAKSLREKLIESIAETEDALLEKFLGGEELNPEELTKALTKAVAAGKLIPIMAGAGLQNIGVLPLMDAIVNYLPPPKDHQVEIVGEDNKPAKMAADPRATWRRWYLKRALTPMLAD